MIVCQVVGGIIVINLGWVAKFGQVVFLLTILNIV